MKRAIEIAKLGAGRVRTNPLVGCVIVKRGRIVSEGYHHYFGGEHAEIDALKKLGFDARGCSMYVSLEPCCHHGKTGPCTDAIIASGAREVFAAMEDPTPKVNCKGIGILRRNGIKVHVGLLGKEARQLNKAFLKNIRQDMPFVAMKAAMSIDGRTATKTGDSKWISSEESRKFSHQLRNAYDAVLVGVNTVIKDNPWLTCRIKDGRNPLRIILDTRLKIPLDSNVLLDDNVVVAASKGYNRNKYLQLKEKGIKVLVVKKDKNGKADIKELMKKLFELDVGSVLIEGGSEVHGSAIESGIVDKCYFFIAPKIIGGRDAKPVIGGEGIDFVKDALVLKDVSVKKIGKDLVVSGYLR